MMLAIVVAAFISSSAAASDFVQSARAATDKYHDRSVAIADGYRLIGSDFPAMGEHWIHTGLLFDSKFDPERPEILSYVVVSGKPRLIGVAYILPLLGGESPPDWPASPDQWHDHFRTIEDETVRPEHHEPGHVGHGPRMAMLHAWIWLDNPAGMFAADNWAIPYFRLGIQPSPNTSEAAAKALALTVAGGAGHLAAEVQVPGKARKKVLVAFEQTRRSVERILERRSGNLSDVDWRKLDAEWLRLMGKIAQVH